ncbi:hypothetical protein KR94_02920 [Pantoea ananatis]|nr:hypothetical protein KR94_02920 [Pantoea ananatis]
MQNSRSVACQDLTIAHFQLHGSVITLRYSCVMRFDRSGCSRAYSSERNHNNAIRIIIRTQTAAAQISAL